MRKKIQVIFIAMLCFGWLSIVNAAETGFHPAIGEVRLNLPGAESAVVTPDGGLALWASNSGLVAGFPVFEESKVFVSSPVLADVNADGIKEIVVLTRDASDVFGVSVYDGFGALLASMSLGTATAYYDPTTLVAAIGAKDGFVVGTNEGDALLFTYNNGQLVSEKIASFGIPISVSATVSGDKIFVTSPLNEEIAVLAKNGAVWEQTQTIQVGQPVIYPVVSDGQNNIFAVTADSGLTAINLDSGEKLANFPIALPSASISSPVLADITADNAGNEISVLMTNGDRGVYDQTGGEIQSGLPKKSFVEPSLDTAEYGGGLMSSVSNFGAQILSKTKHVLGSVFSRVKLVFTGKNNVPVVNSAAVSSISGQYVNPDDLKLSYNLSDANGDSVKPITDWQLNNSSIAVVNMPFEASKTANSTKDYSTFANHGAVFGNPTWLKTGGHDNFGAYQFDGVDDYVSIPDNQSIDGGNTSMSISLWIKTTDKYGQVINKMLGHQGFSYTIYPGSGTSLFRFQDGGVDYNSQYSYAAKDVTDGQWHHVVGVLNREEQTIRTYVDGIDSSKPVRSLSNFGSIDNARSLQIDDVGGEGFEGMIDDLQIYKRALSQEQILLLYQKKTENISKKEINGEESWNACIVPNDGFEDGGSACAEPVSFVLNHVPTQDAPLLAIENENLLVSIQNAQDLDGDLIKPLIDWQLNNSSIAVLNMPFEASKTANSAKDYSTFANHGAVFGNPTWLKTGGHDNFGAYQFDGVDDYVSIPDNQSIDGGNTSMSISLWIKTTDTYGQVLNKLLGKQGFNYTLYSGWGGTSLFYFMDGLDPNYTQHAYVSKDVTDGQWHHVVGVLNREEQTIRTYVDGIDSSKPVRSLSNFGSIDNTKALQIGSVGSEGFEGMIDDLQIYNRALSSEQISLLYQKKTKNISKYEFNDEETWGACVTLNDGFQDGINACAEPMTFSVNHAPTQDIPLLSVESEYLLTSPQNVQDIDNDPVKLTVDWQLNNSSMAVVNMPFEASKTANSAKDYSTFANHGAVFGNPTWLKTGGHDGFGAYQFDGIDDHIDITDNPVIDGGNGSMSVSLWIKTTDTYGQVVNKMLGHQGFGYTIYPGSGTSLFRFQDGGVDYNSQYSYASKDVTDGQWHHVVGVLNREEQTIRTYVDGIDSSKPVRSLSNFGSIDNARALQIGDVGGEGFEGIVDDLQIYNRALSSEQIVTLFNNENNKFMKTETKVGESYKSCLIPNDGVQDGIVMCAGSVSIE